MSANLQGKRVLVVDDHDLIRDIVVSFLEAAGFTVEPVASGEDALAAYLRPDSRFDAVLLDMSMPGMGGARALAELKRHDPDACVVLMSGQDEAAMAMLAGDLGASGHVCKPFTQESLVEALRKPLIG